MPRVTIDGRTLDVPKGRTVLQVARDAGITIPTLCYHPDLSAPGSCRLCLVQVEPPRRWAAACVSPATEGLVIHTETPALTSYRRLLLQMLLSRCPGAGLAGTDQDDTEFLRWVSHYRAQAPEAMRRAPAYGTDTDPNPFIRIDFNKCILCTRCVRACAEVQGRFVWRLASHGSDTHMMAGLDGTLLDGRCESCGACVAYCPTGALDDKISFGLGRPDEVVSTVCGYCGVGCGLDLNIKDGRIIRVTSNPAAPVNGMKLCVKGRYGYDFVHHADRLTKPRVRRYLLEGSAKSLSSGAGREWAEIGWDAALDLVTGKLSAIGQQAGPDALGVLASAKCTNEENYLMQKFARQVLSTHNVDHCARLCHASTVAGLTMAFGSGAMSNSMDDIAGEARAMFLIGSNVTEQHPVFGTMIRQAVLSRRLQLVVADPRQIDIAEFAVLHLRHRPGTDVALVNGLMHIILRNGWHDQEFIDERCEGFEACRAVVERYPPDVVANITGVPAGDLHRAAAILAQTKPMAVVWAMGITQHTSGVLNVLSLANLQMLLGNLGVRGGGVNPLRGQNNVQGACDMGALPHVFPGYQSVTDAAVQAKFDAAWALQPPRGRPGQTPSLGLSGTPGLTVTEMVEAFGAGRLRALYVLGEDLAMTEPDVNHARKCLAAGEFLVLQEIFPSETSAFADVLLPGAPFAEKTGTFTNTERRVQLVRQALEPPGEARPDWAITTDLARRLLACEGRVLAGPHAGWAYRDPANILEEVAALAPSYAGVNASRLERGERLQWPVPDASHPGTPVLHVGRFPSGRGMFRAVDYLPPAEQPDADYPLVLTTGRVLYHWHGGTISRRARGLLALYPEPLIEISPQDAARLGVGRRQQVRVKSRRGEMVSRASITERVPPGLVFANFHFPGPSNVNNLTIGAVDPLAKIPEYKVCAVALEAIPDPP
jgi:formate dehydrogenase alpha subunit